MKKELFGDVCAYIPADPKREADKNRYPKIGTAFKDERGQISIKIDSLPIATGRWEGWVNIFPPKGDKPKPSSVWPTDDGEPF